MSFEKLSKEQWFQMSETERDFHTLEFNKSVESRKRKIIFITRSIAVIFIIALFYMGYVQLEVVKSYGKVLNKYGPAGYCYLCGEKTLKKCECQYNYATYGEDINFTALSENTAEYNIQACNKKDLNPGSINGLNLSI